LEKPLERGRPSKMPDSITNKPKVTVIGFGLMGAQIAQVFAQAGYSVAAFDVSSAQLEQGLQLIRDGRYGVSNSVAKGRMSPEVADQIFARIQPSNNIEDATSGSELILEAAIENLDVKKGIFEAARNNSKPDAILATNTSTLSISTIAAAFGKEIRSRIIGMHFFNPPQVMKLVEVVRTGDTSEKTASRVAEIARDLGKTPISVMDVPGFVANRIGLSAFAEASYLLDKGVASVRDIDLAMRLGYGYPLGPFELGDLVGLDARLRNLESLYSESGDEKFKPPEILKKLVSQGYIGDPKTKKGSKGGYYEFYGLKKPSEDS
jgi:3-hydroxybutyryl-CoA dehydrogenase